MAGLERMALRADLVGEPGDAERRMAEHAGGEPALFNLGVAIHDAADPAQVDVHRADWASAQRNGGAQNIGKTDTGALQTFAHDEGEFDLDAGLAVVRVLRLGAVADHLVVEDSQKISNAAAAAPALRSHPHCPACPGSDRPAVRPGG